MSDSELKYPLLALDEADREFVLRFVLASGSLKEMAQAYGVSYPTIRTRLDRVIEVLRRAREGREVDPMSELLASLFERGEVSASAARAVQELNRKAYEAKKEG